MLQERASIEKLAQLPDSVGQTIAANVYIPLSSFKALYGEKNVDRSVGHLKLKRLSYRKSAWSSILWIASCLHCPS